MKRTTLIFAAVLFVLTMLPFSTVSADEGMWLFENSPKKQILEKYGFELKGDFLEHLQKSSIRFPGGSGSFVSPDGLVMTNHHVGLGIIQRLSTVGNDYVKNGFLAKSRADEIKCPNLELIVLMEIEDVTAQIEAAVPENLEGEKALEARRAAIAKIENESFEKTGYKSDLVSLYQGGLYHLYRYKKYDDVRLVFAPEHSIAAFGGDPDNFEYPRYDLDCCFFRCYENDAPAEIEHYLKWSTENPKEDDLVFVTGHPGSTDRAQIPEHLAFQRDFLLPKALEKLRRREVLLKTYAERSEENKRRATSTILGLTNSRKVRLGQLAGLQNPDIFKWDDSKEIPGRRAIPEALYQWKRMYGNYDLFESGSVFNSRTFSIAKSLVRLAAESEKPESERFPEYNETNIESIKRSLLSPAPIYEDMEVLTLADGLSLYLENRALPHWNVNDSKIYNPWYEPKMFDAIMAGKSPQKRAAELINNSKIRDIEERRRYIEGGMKAITESDDPMIKLALAVDPETRALRKQYEKSVREPLRIAYTALAKERFEREGTDIYPDATFTLRLSYGTVKGYTESDGTNIPAWTELGGTFERAELHDFVPPYDLPESWIENRGKLDPKTPMNIVTTNDIIGGNSGSPLVNKKGEVVGLIFDGNIQSLVSSYLYEDTVSRAVSVHAAAIIESLRKVYKAEELLEELGQ